MPAGTRLRLLLVIVGLALFCTPVWWYTTQVHRVDIHYEVLQSLSAPVTPSWAVRVEFVIVDGAVEASSAAQLPEKLCSSLNTIETATNAGRNASYTLLFACSLKAVAPSDLATFKPLLDRLTVIIVSEKLKESAVIQSNGRVAIVSLQPQITAAKLNAEVVPALTKRILALFLKLDVNAAEAVKQHPKYHITFSLLVEDARVASVAWPRAELIDNLFARAVKTLGALGSFSIDSQVIPFASTTHRPPKYDTKTQTHFYTVADLPHFINANEWKIESTSARGTTINFLLFVPSEAHLPLQIRKSSDASTATSSKGFIVPQWGAVNFVAPKSKLNNSILTLTEDDLRPAITESLMQLRRLVGVTETVLFEEAFSISFARRPNIVLENFELESLLRHSTALHLNKARETLSSFGNMVKDLRTIPIRADVLREIDLTLSRIQNAEEHAVAGDWASAFASAIEASETAERIFFNKDMLAMLYFPDEHVFAIYVPLFVPVSFPLITGLWHEFSRRRKKAAEKAKAD